MKTTENHQLTNEMCIIVLIIANGNFNKRTWLTYQEHLKNELQKNNRIVLENQDVPQDESLKDKKHIRVKVFHPQISCKKKLSDKFDAVILCSCDAHQTKKYHKYIKEMNDDTVFFSLNPEKGYELPGIKNVQNFQDAINKIAIQ